jgi:hypothetical protein
MQNVCYIFEQVARDNLVWCCLRLIKREDVYEKRKQFKTRLQHTCISYKFYNLSCYDIPELVVPIRISLTGLLLTRKLLNQVVLLIKLNSSLQKFYGRHHDLVMEYLCHK